MTRETISISTDGRLTVTDITDRVNAAIPDGAEGTALVFTRHTTAAITVNEAESRLLADFEAALSDLVADDGWRHDRVDDNADSHIRSMLLGPTETLPVSDGTLDLGTWQSVLFVECDGPRSRSVVVQV